MILDNVFSLTDLWQYFDDLIELENDDVLFASSYLRGFIEVAATEFGDERQSLSNQLYALVNQQLVATQQELNEADLHLVQQFWRDIKPRFS